MTKRINHTVLIFIGSSLIWLSGPLPVSPVEVPQAAVRKHIAAILDDFHRAAADADESRYLGHMSEDAVFLGTDAAERWNKKTFQAFVHPYFSTGAGWEYIPQRRHIVIDSTGQMAWFDELLLHKTYGTLRGTGVLKKFADTWKISQYSLTFTIPNHKAREVVQLLRGE